MGLALLGITATSTQASAQVRQVRWDPVGDPVVLGAGSVALVASELLKSTLVPPTCRWCEVDGLDLETRNALVWRSTSTAGATSSVIAFGLAPASVGLTLGLAAAHDHAFRQDFGADLVLVGEATVLALDLDQLTKFLVARRRPFAYERDRSEGDPHGDPPPHADPDDDLSFFSGHTTATFAMAAAVGTVATMRGYRWAPVTWIAGGALAATTGYLRIAADKHWLTDVVTAVVVGTAVGIFVPVAFHSPRGTIEGTGEGSLSLRGGAAPGLASPSPGSGERRRLPRRIEHLPHAAGELLRLDRLAEEMHSRFERSLGIEDVVRVARHEKHPDLGMIRDDPLRELVAAHAGHHHVRDHEIDGSLRVLAERQRVRAARRREELVPVASKDLDHEVAHDGLVLYDQDRLRARCRGRLRRRIDEVDRETRSSIQGWTLGPPGQDSIDPFSDLVDEPQSARQVEEGGTASQLEEPRFKDPESQA
jgi:membrane-associated phospholipid phosphatase